MRTVHLAQAKAGLSALLDAVEAGEDVVITRRGRPVARLIRPRRRRGPWLLGRPSAPQPRPPAGAGGFRSGAAAGVARSGAMRAAEIYTLLG
ncbi:MAG: type II toxin-antitoxin system Phd/YefM family antitoxin [Synechococcaceae cyanobacterium]